MGTLLTSMEASKQGRKGDEIVAHLTPGEIVIPRPFAEDDDFRATVAEFFRGNDIDLEEFIVGSGKNKINPETGYMEFGFWKSITKPFRAIFKSVKKLFFPGAPKIPTPPPLPPPIPTPTEIDIEARRKGEEMRRKLRLRAGRRGTILTEAGTLGAPVLGKATLLGRTM